MCFYAGTAMVTTIGGCDDPSMLNGAKGPSNFVYWSSDVGFFNIYDGYLNLSNVEHLGKLITRL